MKILVVDDDPDHLKTLTDFLAGMGNAIGRHKWSEALVLWDEWKPDVLICSEFADGINAWRVCRELRRDIASRPHILVLANRPSKKDKALCEEFGSDNYIAKPIHEEDLVQIIVNVAERINWS